MEKVINKVNMPSDVKKLSVNELTSLATDIREIIIEKVNNTGGHMGPNLGIVEATIALHYVFDSPKDKFVFDVSHQCYPHKIVTGRKQGFIDKASYATTSGYTNPKESKHDFFTVGHTSTSISLATGLAKARDLKGENENIIAVIGDGSLSGGQAYEGLNNAAVLNSNFIILVNDNEMSIAENHGSLYSNLAHLRETKGNSENNFFKSLGFTYYYVENGNDVASMIATLKKVKDSKQPVVVHMHTLKGKGLEQAEQNKESWHWVAPGKLTNKETLTKEKESYTDITKEYILQKTKEDSSVVTITPGIPGAHGFTAEFREQLGHQYVDVGIAEEHAVAFASGIAANGGKPILTMMSSFTQRTYDQLSQDLCLNRNAATILIFGNGINGADATHLGTFDIPLISNIPNMVYLAPTNKEEYLAMLDWSVNQTEHPVTIRVPSGEVIATGVEDTTDYTALNTFKVEEKGEQIAIVALGSFFTLGKEVKDVLKEKYQIHATLINPRYITGIDTQLLTSLSANHDIVITLEDGLLDGGFGEKITRFYGATKMKVLNFGSFKEFTDREAIDSLLERYHLTTDLIVSDIIKCIKN